jgi:hypothetical protein
VVVATALNVRKAADATRTRLVRVGQFRLPFELPCTSAAGRVHPDARRLSEGFVMRLKPASYSAAALICILAPTLAGAVIDPALKCQAAKMKLSGKYAACRLIEDAAATKTGTTPDYSTCDARLATGWQKVESSIGTDCPTLGELEEAKDSLVECISARYLVRFHLTSSSTLTALQFSANYAAANGSFVGEGSNVACWNSITGALFAKHDYDGSEYLQLGALHLDNFTGPIEVARCTFEVTDSTAPLSSQFALTIEDATDSNGNPVPGVTLGVSISQAP